MGRCKEGTSCYWCSLRDDCSWCGVESVLFLVRALEGRGNNAVTRISAAGMHFLFFTSFLARFNTMLQAKYLNNHWSLTKFCVIQFKGTRVEVTKAESQVLHEKIARAKCYSDMQDILGDSSGGEEFRAIVKAIEECPPREHRMIMSSYQPHVLCDHAMVTPEGTQNPEPPGSGAPFLPNDFGKIHPVPNCNSTTPTPGGSNSPASIYTELNYVN